LAEGDFVRFTQYAPTEKEQDELLARLSLLFQVVYLINETQGPAVAALFLRSSNPELNDEAPLTLIAHDGHTENVRRRVLGATRVFLES
jgi:hypothetical protein